MSKNKTPKPSSITDGDKQQPALTANSQDDSVEREAPATNASVMMLAGGFLAAMFIVVAAEFVRHHIS